MLYWDYVNDKFRWRHWRHQYRMSILRLRQWRISLKTLTLGDFIFPDLNHIPYTKVKMFVDENGLLFRWKRLVPCLWECITIITVLSLCVFIFTWVTSKTMSMQKNINNRFLWTWRVLQIWNKLTNKPTLYCTSIIIDQMSILRQQCTHNILLMGTTKSCFKRYLRYFFIHTRKYIYIYKNIQ